MIAFLAKIKDETTGELTNMFVCENLTESLGYIEKHCSFNQTNASVEAITDEGRYGKTIKINEEFEETENWILEQISWLKGKNTSQ